MEAFLDNLWLLVACVLVLFMQAGFLLIEGGRVRAKNSINVAQKNLTDLVIAWVCFMSFGFYLMYGLPVPGAESTGVSTVAAQATPLHFLFQLAFCGTAVTLMSGAVAERMSYKAYILLVVAISGAIYPLVGRMVWGDNFTASDFTFLADIGFIDFAGASVVHGVGGWASLVAVLMLGPRIGRFDDSGKPIPMPANNAVIALLGVLIILVGWIGFNGGSLSFRNPILPLVIVNTLTSAVFGGLVGAVLGFHLDKGVFNPSAISNGLIGGLVCCTAAINLMDYQQAALVGSLGGLIAVGGAYLLLYRFKLDDPVDVIACHGLAGAVGTLAVAAVAPVSVLAGQSRILQLGIQATGIVVIIAVVSVLTWLALKVIAAGTPIRVSAMDEKLGLNYTEHGVAIGTGRLEIALQRKLNGSEAMASGLNLPDSDEHSELASTLTQLLDQNDEVRALINNSEKRFRQFAEIASDWLWETDANHRLTYISASKQDIESVFSEMAIGSLLLDTLSLEADAKRHVAQCFDNQVATSVFDAKISFLHNRAVQLFVEVTAVPHLGDSGEFNGYRGVATDITVRKAAENRAVFLAEHDELTGLFNRRGLSNSLPKILASADEKGTAVVVAGIDLDGFKAVNDSHGHSVGDLLLEKVAKRLEDEIRPGDQVFRTGGDEFVLIMPDFSKTSALDGGLRVSERIVDVISQNYELDSAQVNIGTSIGVAVYPSHSKSSQEIIRMADLALYAAKSNGKGCVVPYEESMDFEAKYLQEMQSDLRAALEKNEFHLVYQPLVDASTEQLIGFEALIRWDHPVKGEIQPGAFIDIAEKLCLMDQIGTFVLESACKFATTWSSEAGKVAPKISVNVSPQQFKNDDFLEIVKNTLTNTGLEASRLELEITENLLIEDLDKVVGILENLRDMGVSVAIDDFGSGQTSLRYLNQFPVSTLKIDRSFIKHLGQDSKAEEITETIVSLGKKLGVTVLAEGVEDKAQLAQLQSWDCDLAQGFYFSRPMSDENVLVMIENESAAISRKDKAA